MDPYKVLGVTPQTSDDDVKRAYRELARKYHPDNYVNNPLADLAEARMKEINEAYDMIMNERSGKTAAGGSGQSYGGQQTYGGYQQSTYTGANAALYAQVRQAINQGNLGLAEQLLQRRLVFFLARKVSRAVGRGKRLVVRGVVALHVDAVEHAVELALVHAHHRFQPVGKVGALELLGVGRAHGGHGVGRDDRAL